MEWHTLNSSLQRDTVIDGFESFIWTERYSSVGDFQIVTESSYDNRSLLKPGTWIGMEGSDRVMEIESLSDSVGEDGTKNITVTGRSIEKILDDRIAMPALAGLVTTPKWVITGTPGAITRKIFTDVCVTHVLNANDTIPYYHSGTFLPAGGITEPADSVTIEFDPATVYNDIKQVCDMFQMGFRLVKDGDTGNLYFDIYMGSNRTSKQTTLPAVIFSPDLETIDKTSVLHSTALLKNVAYVFAPNGTAVVYAPGYDSSVSGAQRRILIVKAEDIDLPAGAELTAALTQKGSEELAKNREVYAFDGEIPQYQPFVYGLDYGLGDVVEERNPDGFANFMLVTEQIFISDGEGERSYPALTLSLTLTPGTWDKELVTEHWDDVAADKHWDDA